MLHKFRYYIEYLLLYSRYFSNETDNDNSNKDNEKILSIFRYINADKLSTFNNQIFRYIYFNYSFQ